jgi:hypothetical protein
MGLKVPLIIQVVARCALPRACRCNITIVDLGALYTMAKGRDHDIVRALKLIQRPYYGKLSWKNLCGHGPSTLL